MVVLSWFSCGVTSAVATKIATEIYDNVKICYFDTGAAHPDNKRFLKQCEKWFGQKIEIYKSERFSDPLDVAKKRRWLNGIGGAKCTTELKKKLRFKIEKENDYSAQVFGFEYGKREINRALRFVEQYPDTRPVFPLIQRKLKKRECLHILERAGIARPAMYAMGYKNNNCIGCFKGATGYWNKIRIDFPDVFDKTAKLERELGASCINGKFLDEIPMDAGHTLKEIMPSCDIVCDLELKDLKVYDIDDAIKQLQGELNAAAT